MNKGVSVIFKIKSIMMSVLLPEVCYKVLKSDLTVLITFFCYLVAILRGKRRGEYFINKGLKKLDLFCFNIPICYKMLIFLDNRCLESCQMGEENQNRFFVVIIRSTVYL